MDASRGKSRPGCRWGQGLKAIAQLVRRDDDHGAELASRLRARFDGAKTLGDDDRAVASTSPVRDLARAVFHVSAKRGLPDSCL